MHRPAIPARYAVVLLAVAWGCGREVPYPATPVVPSATVDVPEAEPAPALVDVLVAPGPRLAVEVAKVDGVDATRVFAPSRASLSECAAGSGSVLRIRIKSDDSRASMEVEPGSSVSGTARRCVLEALSIVDFPDVVAESKSSTQPHVYSSLVTISW